MDPDEKRVRQEVLEELEDDPKRYLAQYSERFGNVLNADDAATLFDGRRPSRCNLDPGRAIPASVGDGGPRREESRPVHRWQQRRRKNHGHLVSQGAIPRADCL